MGDEDISGIMEKHYQFTDQGLLLAMENSALDPKLFSHEAHLRWGWLLLEYNSLEEAINKACTQLKQYTTHLGAFDKYNETVTIAAMRAIHHFRLKSEADNFMDFIVDCSRLKTSFKELMDAHYSENIFNSVLAKKQYLQPDKAPFN